MQIVWIFVFLGIDELMTPEEKAKLFTAIGYSDSTHDLSLPKQVSNLWDGLKKTHSKLCVKMPSALSLPWRKMKASNSGKEIFDSSEVGDWWSHKMAHILGSQNSLLARPGLDI